MERFICLLIGYAFGLIQTGYIYGKMKGVDIRKGEVAMQEALTLFARWESKRDLSHFLETALNVSLQL